MTVKQWRLDLVLFLIAGILISLCVGGLTTELLRHVRHGLFDGNESFLRFLIGTLSLQGVSLFLVAWFLREHELTVAGAFGFTRRALGRTLLLAILVAAVAIPLTWALNEFSGHLLTWAHRVPQEQPAVTTLRSAASANQETFFGLVAVFLAPVVEEVLFRGIFYPALKSVLRRSVALWLVALGFAAIHASLVTFVPLTVLAGLLALLYEETGNLAAPITTHCLFNAVNYFWLMQQRASVGG